MCKAEVAQRGRRVTPEFVPYSLLEKMTKLENNLALTITIIIFRKRIHYYLHQYRVWIENVKLSPWLVEMKVKVLVAQPCLTLCNPVDCSPPGSSVHRIFHARMLEWVAMPSSRGSSQPRDQTQVSHIAGRFFTSWDTRETLRRGILITYSQAVKLVTIPGYILCSAGGSSSYMCVHAQSLQSCPTLCDPVDYRLFCSWDSPGKNAGVDCHALLYGIFPAQGLSLWLLCLQCCWRILYPLSHKGNTSPCIAGEFLELKTWVYGRGSRCNSFSLAKF